MYVCVCVWQVLLAENSFRRTNHLIPICFFLLCSSLFTILDGRIRSLANVYTLSFLCVMILFALGNMMLKYKRGRIRRPVSPHPPHTPTPQAFILEASIPQGCIGSSTGSSARRSGASAPAADTRGRCLVSGDTRGVWFLVVSGA